MENCPEHEKTIEQRVIDIVAFQTGVESEKINCSTHLVKDLGLDSLESVELVMEMEEEFSNDNVELHIPDEDAEKLIKVGDIIDYVAKRISNPQ